MIKKKYLIKLNLSQIRVNLDKNNITLYLNGELRNKIHTVKAESLFDRMLKIAKLKFLKMRDQVEQA